jgi:hypothetical protein
MKATAVDVEPEGLGRLPDRASARAALGLGDELVLAPLADRPDVDARTMLFIAGVIEIIGRTHRVGLPAAARRLDEALTYHRSAGLAAPVRIVDGGVALCAPRRRCARRARDFGPRPGGARADGPRRQARRPGRHRPRRGIATPTRRPTRCPSEIRATVAPVLRAGPAPCAGGRARGRGGTRFRIPSGMTNPIHIVYRRPVPLPGQHLPLTARRGDLHPPRDRAGRDRSLPRRLGGHRGLARRGPARSTVVAVARQARRAPAGPGPSARGHRADGRGLRSRPGDGPPERADAVGDGRPGARPADAVVRPARRARAEVPDPYYGGDRGFDEVYAMLVRACDGLLDHLLDEPFDVSG